MCYHKNKSTLLLFILAMIHQIKKYYHHLSHNSFIYLPTPSSYLYAHVTPPYRLHHYPNNHTHIHTLLHPTLPTRTPTHSHTQPLNHTPTPIPTPTLICTHPYKKYTPMLTHTPTHLWQQLDVDAHPYIYTNTHSLTPTLAKPHRFTRIPI